MRYEEYVSMRKRQAELQMIVFGLKKHSPFVIESKLLYEQLSEAPQEFHNRFDQLHKLTV